MRAIDLYAGIGGWSLGLRLAGVEVAASYEWWQPAIDTHNGNHGGAIGPVDIRKLDLKGLPGEIDLVVGSPPCTEFSYSNRGGGGNISEGIKDLVRFLQVVDFVKPRFWALENVPRVAKVLSRGFSDPKHVLYKFRHLRPSVMVVDFSDYGAAQARRRCIAGNIPFDILESYKSTLSRRTLGDVVQGLSAAGQVRDPIWGVTLQAECVTECQSEAALNAEELRMNRESKEFHPVYNNMAFPDSMDQPSRTVTATCTRVSRESIVISDPKYPDQFRRLTIRERASLQGFPITYQFYARSSSDKAKMIGNAIPATFTYLVAMAARGVSAGELPGFERAGATLALPGKQAPVTPPDKEGRSYPETRSFRAAIPGLRFKSGMRFELANHITGDAAEWRIKFFFGSSKDIREVELDGDASEILRRAPLIGAALASLRPSFIRAERNLWSTNPESLQSVWTRRADGVAPYDVTDMLGDLVAELYNALGQIKDDLIGEYAAAFVLQCADDTFDHGNLPNRSKLEKYSLKIIAGLVVGEWFNTLGWHARSKKAASPLNPANSGFAPPLLA
jgi:DNA (cytosine-5)-methyltransferase 1